MDINTYNESSLHKTLKTLYASENGFQTEVKKDGYIYDILDAEGNAIEIQTKNLSKLLPKIKKNDKTRKKDNSRSSACSTKNNYAYGHRRQNNC